MNSEPRLFESSAELHFSATPLPCPRAMRPQTLVVWTPARLLFALMLALLAAPRAAPVIRGRRV